MPLRVGYVREHFSSPLLQYAEEDAGTTFTLVECPSGTGQIITKLKNNEIDVAIALTDPLISGIANGSTSYKLVGSYVSSPLNWAVIVTGKDSRKYNKIEDFEKEAGKTINIGISRLGSGSQTMAYVLACKQGWNPEFKVKNDINGLITSVNDGSTSAFMWEWFTTKPRSDMPGGTGEVHFIGNVPTPWKYSWLIVAQPGTDPAELRIFLETLSVHVRKFGAADARMASSLEFIKNKFKDQNQDDIKEWLDSVAYPENCAEIPRSVIYETFSGLKHAGVVEGDFDVNEFVDTRVVTLTEEP